ncbi:MAG: hypothetical protein O7H40_16070 [Gammaproteobacteria bacterium]|nr:hypothetical protein [Gammaproteobacteria bacterium]
MNLHCLSVEEAFALINAEDTGITRAIADTGSEICRAIELVIESFLCGGRLIYVGAGKASPDIIILKPIEP